MLVLFRLGCVVSTLASVEQQKRNAERRQGHDGKHQPVQLKKKSRYWKIPLQKHSFIKILNNSILYRTAALSDYQHLGLSSPFHNFHDQRATVLQLHIVLTKSPYQLVNWRTIQILLLTNFALIKQYFTYENKLIQELLNCL